MEMAAHQSQILPQVIREALRIRDLSAKQCSYSCHTESPYSDGYEDASYGDYSDSEPYSDDGE